MLANMRPSLISFVDSICRSVCVGMCVGVCVGVMHKEVRPFSELIGPQIV